jgi:hypothetical protein
MSDGVATVHKDYKKFAPKWKRCRDVCAGQDAVHAAGTAYLPRLKAQKNDAYNAYVMRTPFVNYSWRTVAALLGLVFRKEPKVTNPAGLDPYLEDVSQSGTPLKVFCKQVTSEILEVGRVSVLVDYPTAPQTDAPLVVAQAEGLGLRPTMKVYPAETFINWKYRTINNKYVLSMAVLRECATEAIDEFEDKESDQYRVLDLEPGTNYYRVRMFQRTDGKDVQIGGAVYPLMDGKPLDFIPLYTIDVDGQTCDIDEPPLIDLFDLNLSHYRTSADYENGCHFTGLPTPYITGWTPEPGMDGDKPAEIGIGSDYFILQPSKDAKLGYLEFNGTGLDALVKNKEGKESQMAMLGSRVLGGDKAGVEAFKTVAIRNNGETSILSSISLAVSLGITGALNTFAKWAGKAGECEVKLNRDFAPVGMDAQTLTALLATVQAGRMSNESFFDLLQRSDLQDADLSYEDEQARIDAQPPPAPMLTGPGAKTTQAGFPPAPKKPTPPAP